MNPAHGAGDQYGNAKHNTIGCEIGEIVVADIAQQGAHGNEGKYK